MVHQTSHRITNAVKIYECTLIRKHTAEHEISNKYVDDDQFNNTTIHSTKFVEFCKGATSPNCYLFVHKTRSLAVDYTDRSINDVIKIEIRYQSYLDTNIQFGKSTESPGCTSLNSIN